MWLSGRPPSESPCDLGKSRPLLGLSICTWTKALACQGFLNRPPATVVTTGNTKVTRFALSQPLQGHVSQASPLWFHPRWLMADRPWGDRCQPAPAHSARYSCQQLCLLPCSGNTQCPLVPAPAHTHAGAPSRDTGGQKHLEARPLDTVGPVLNPTHSKLTGSTLDM